ncbi:putative serine protease K12H4.7 [Anneissia japonica]|uniref:putative serine protease K12H4.7 n=1 Tax=Anneissia japonica TaxID=1529436 RepID=UPI0014254D13|nr:putative serine protease K12H4.7 [Anneissia japonica]
MSMRRNMEVYVAGHLLVLSIVLSFVIVVSEAAYPKYLLGRPRGGMLPPPVTNKYHVLPPDQWIEQKLDHFDPTNTKTWKQRYFVNDTFFKEGGPVFLMIGGEGTADPIWMVTGTWIEFAKTYNALCVMLEHRFYGKSHPTSDLSVENLKFLSSEQGLADLAYFRQYIASKMKVTDNKWVSFGGSYPGSLSVWFRLKYPHLVDGAVATSAPVEATLDFTGYLDVVRDSLATSKYGSKCNDNIQSATNMIESLLDHPLGWRTLTDTFKLCNPLNGTNKNDIANMFESLVGNFMNVVQYNKDNRKFEGAVGTEITIDTICDIMCNESGGDVLERYAQFNKLIMSTYKEKCLDISYDSMLAEYRKVSWDSAAAEGGRQWVYQTCSEFAFFQTTDSKDQPFGQYIPLSFFIQLCQDVYGERFNKSTIEQNIKRTNTNYGGYGVDVSKVVFPNGSIDPWHALGITKDIGDDATAIFINGTAHCANMYPATSDDPPQLVQARKAIQASVQQWIQ